MLTAMTLSFLVASISSIHTLKTTMTIIPNTPVKLLNQFLMMLSPIRQAAPIPTNFSAEPVIIPHGKNGSHTLSLPVHFLNQHQK
jgi:hypothetical protein